MGGGTHAAPVAQARGTHRGLAGRRAGGRLPVVDRERTGRELGEKMQRPRNSSLDGLRGFASVHVALGHLAVAVDYHPLVAKLFVPVRYGLRGVPLFLFLSGFLLTRSELRRPARQPLGTFYKRRWL